MMLGMPGDQVRQGPNRGLPVVGGSPARPRGSVQVSEEMNRRAPDAFKLLGEFRHRHIGMVRMLCPWILIETRKLRAVVPGKDESPVREDPLSIHDVPEKFLD